MNKKIVIPSSGKAISLLAQLAKRKAEFQAKVEELLPFKSSKKSINASVKKGCN